MIPVKELPQFQFIGNLGTGGTAEVYKVLTQRHNVAALKTKLQSSTLSDSEFQKLALREQTLTKHLNFPGIVKIHDVQLDPTCYILLEYCDGKTLESYDKIENIHSVLNILSSIAINLEFLHLQSIVHADLKPDNVFMPFDISCFASGKLSFSKLSDFSLGKFELEDNSTRAGLGTIGFMAPETIKENIVTHQSDLFALGVIAYQIISGQHPFITDDADPVKINSRILEEKPTPLNQYRNDLPNELIQLVERLLEKDASKRIQSAWEVCELLRTAGATYPFEKALNPKYLINKKETYSTNLQPFSNYHEKLDTISDKKNKQLRLLISHNFSKGNLYYKEKQFHFKNSPLIPSCLIRQSLKEFSQLTYNDKKNAIESSLKNNKQNLISSLLPHLLRLNTITRVSKRLAIVEEQNNNYATAATLYVLTGDLLKAENSAYQAAMIYKNDNDIESALKLLEKIISLGNLTNRKFEIKSLIMSKGDLLKDLGEVDKAETVYNELIDLYRNHEDDELLAETYKDLGDLYKMKRTPDKGIKALEKALSIFEKLDNKLEISKTYNNLGNIYTIKNDYKKALSYFKKALRIQRKLSAEDEVASTLNNIATTYALVSKFRRALKIFKLSLTITMELGNKGEIARTLNNIGYCYEILGENQKAVEVLHKAMRYNKEIDSKGEILFNLENLTSIMYSTGQLKESISYLKEGIILATELNDQSHIGMFNLYMGAVLVRLGKLKESYISFKHSDNTLNIVDDSYLQALLYIEKARLAIFINNKSDAKNLLDHAYTIYREIQDKTILIKILLLKLKITIDLSLITEADKIINELELTKEKPILSAIKLNYYLSIDNSQEAETVYKSLSETVLASDEQIEQCYLYNSLASFLLFNNDLEQAITFVNRSVKTASSRSLHFDSFNSLVLYGRILSKQNETEQCFSVYKQALGIAKNIFNQLGSDTDKQAFQKKEDFVFLALEIKKLTKIIGQKKEQMY